MELQELINILYEIFKVSNPEELKNKIYESVINNDYKIYEMYEQKVGNLEQDLMQKVYQYYLADRESLKQDYTPKSLAKLVSKLALMNDNEKIIDMCSGSGALTIYINNITKENEYELKEFDDNVMPFLLFNMAIRNIGCEIYRMDVLQDEIYAKYKLTKKDKYSFVEVENENINK